MSRIFEVYNPVHIYNQQHKGFSTSLDSPLTARKTKTHFWFSVYDGKINLGEHHMTERSTPMDGWAEPGLIKVSADMTED